MKKMLFMFIMLTAFIIPSTAFAADQGISVYVDGTKLQFTSKPIQENGTTLVPLRTIFEVLGANVKWDAKTQTVSASKEGVNIQIVLGKKFASRNGQVIPLTTKPRSISGVTYVPLRFIGESFGNTIEVKGKQIYIQSPQIPSFEYIANPPTTASTPNSTSTSSNLSIQEVGRLSNRVVYIEVYNASNKVISSGSGVVISADGEILTNFHVIDGASTISVEFNDQRAFKTSTLLLKDETRDLALIKIDAKSLPYVNIGDSTKLELGEEVVAIGSPLGYKNSLTSGVVSQTLRTVEGQNYIQISAPIDHGSSGGALFNMRGELVGVTSAFIQSSADINLAIPSSDVTTFLTKSKVAQSLTTVLQQKPNKNTSSNKITATSLTDYMNENYGVITYKDLNLDFEWVVIPSKNGEGFILGGTMYDGTQWADWMDYQVNGNNSVPVAASVILYLSDELHDELGLSDTFFTLYLNVYLSSYPSSFPYSAITSEGRGYRLDYNFAYGKLDYSTGYYGYTADPEDEDAFVYFKLR
ncbi:trypsin-like peptidase domain-containing protein [Paenibacillus segetis]|nr:trypsin-like peptidase domain-containing protein [Paenibacillus segetis]